MKKTVSVVLVLLLALSFAIFSACSKPAKPDETAAPAKPVDMASLWESVKTAAGYGAMTAVPKTDLSDIYGIDVSKIEEQVWYMSENPSLNADEFAMFKLSDASYAEQLSGILKARIERQLQVAQTYSPEQAAKLENAKVTVSGSYVYFCVAENCDAAVNAIESALN